MASNGFPLPDFSKAKLFSDEKSAARILATRDPMTQKMIGRKVAGFDQQIWERSASRLSSWDVARSSRRTRG